jgi:hypothetical protein
MGILEKIADIEKEIREGKLPYSVLADVSLEEVGCFCCH